MSTTPTELEDLIRTKTQDAKPYINDDWQSALATAVLDRDELIPVLIEKLNRQLSNYNPRLLIGDFNGSGAVLYPLRSLFPTTFNDDFSEVQWVRWPWDPATPEMDVLKEDRDYTIDRRLFGISVQKHLVFFVGPPQAGEDVRIKYTALHDLTVNPITVDDAHVNAFANLVAGHYIHDHIAPEFLQHIDGTITADIVGQLTPVPDVKLVGTNLIEDFYRHFGIDINEQGIQGRASNWKQWPLNKAPRSFWYHK